MSPVVWIRQPHLWEAAKKLAASRLRPGSSSYWRRVWEEYIKKGGRTEDNGDFPLQEGVDLFADSNEE